MENLDWLFISIFLVGIGALIGFFITKKPGYGRFTTSTFLILVTLIVSSLLYSAGKLEPQHFANIVFAVIGFAGGLFTGKDESKQPTMNCLISRSKRSQRSLGRYAATQLRSYA